MRENFVKNIVRMRTQGSETEMAGVMYLYPIWVPLWKGAGSSNEHYALVRTPTRPYMFYYLRSLPFMYVFKLRFYCYPIHELNSLQSRMTFRCNVLCIAISVVSGEIDRLPSY